MFASLKKKKGGGRGTQYTLDFTLFLDLFQISRPYCLNINIQDKVKERQAYTVFTKQFSHYSLL